ncbi:MAG: RND family transporter, partial [Rhodothermia bacterium]
RSIQVEQICRGETMLRFGDFIMRQRWPVIIVTVVITALMAWQATKVTLNGDFSNYLREDDPLVREYNRVGEVFGGKETGIVLVTAENIFTAENLKLVAQLTETFGNVDGISDVLSLTNVVDFRKTDWGLEVRRLVDVDAPPETPEALESLRTYVTLEERYRGNLVSDDGTTTALLLRFDGGVDQFATSMRVEAAADEAAPPEKRPSGTNVYYGGMPFLVFNMTLLITDNLLYLVPLMVLVLILILFLGFRHWAGVLFPLLVVGVSVVWVTGLMGVFGLQFDLLTGIMPVVLLALGSADAIHLLKRYFERRRDGDSARQGARMVFKEMGTPIILTTITTMVGFSSLALSDFSVIQQFGLLTALGVLIALIVSLTLLPALLSLGVGPARTEGTGSLRLLDGLSIWVYGHKTAVLVGGLAVFALSVIAIPRIVKDVDWSLCLARDSAPWHAEMLLREKFGGSLPVQVLVRGDLKDPAVLSMMRTIERRLETVPEVSNARSMAGLLSDMNNVLNDRLSVPASRQAVGNLWLLVEGEEIVNQMVAKDEQEALVQARLATWHTGSLVAAVDRIDNFLATLPGRIAVVDMNLVEDREAALDLRREQVLRNLELDFEKYGVEPEASLLSRAVERAAAAGLGDVARDRVRKATAEYLRSPEAEVPLNGTAIERISVGVAASLDDLRVENLLSSVRRASPDLSDDDAYWLAGSLVETARVAQGEVRFASALEVLPESVGRDRNFYNAVRGTLWQINEDVLYLDPVEARRLSGSNTEAVLREVDWVVTQTGLPPVLNQMEAELTPTQVTSLLTTLVFVIILLTIIFRSFLGGLLAVVPISLTILVNFAVMGYTGIGLDSFTVMIAAIAIGLGIDTDIHFISRLRNELRVDGNELAAFKRTVQTTGLSVLINAVAVGGGFLVLLAAGGQHIRRFGGLTALAVVLSAVFTLTVLAALLLWLMPRFLDQAKREGAK